MEIRTIVVASDADPVARRLLDRWGTPAPTGVVADGAGLRRLAPRTALWRRPGPHIHDDNLDSRLPPEVVRTRPVLVFPSIHKSERDVESLTVHPLGNPGPTAEVGGRPRTLNETAPRRMSATLRRLAELGRSLGLPATFEATHHGPYLGLPAFFVEIGYGRRPGPTDEAVRGLATLLTEEVDEDPRDRVAVGAGGGHYAPHFTDLVLKRRWSFGHLLSRHALAEIDRPTAVAAWSTTPGAEGIVFARAEDAESGPFAGLAGRLSDSHAPRRESD